ncbi:hypothetical protein JHK87_031427 [Glycine soja]|nr:hypothetical protein JHK87_031427 [Glycine soja]
MKRFYIVDGSARVKAQPQDDSKATLAPKRLSSYGKHAYHGKICTRDRERTQQKLHLVGNENGIKVGWLS